MRTHVDFEFSKKFGIHVKGDVKSFYKPFARELQDEEKVGKILGPTKSKEDMKVLEDAKKLIQEEVDAQVNGLKKENVDLKKQIKVLSNKLDKQASNRATK